MDAALAFAKNIVNNCYEDLPIEVVSVTKRSILDTIGVMLAASTLGDGVTEIVKLVKDGGGNAERTIIASGKKGAGRQLLFLVDKFLPKVKYR